MEKMSNSFTEVGAKCPLATFTAYGTLILILMLCAVGKVTYNKLVCRNK